MNYLAEILAFQELAQDKSLSSGQIALWYALMYINNRCQWQEWFTVANRSLESNCGLSRQGINKARNVLKQLGLIDFKSNGTKASSYSMRTMLKSVQDSLQVGCQNSLQSSLQVGCQNSSTLNKRNERKGNILPPISPKTKNCFEIFAGGNQELLSALQDFEAMRNKIKKPMTDRAKQIMLKQLKELSADPKEQVAILEKSVFKSWAGVFPLREKAEKGQSQASYDISAFEKLGYDIPEV